MTNQPNQPEADDAVLGGQAPPPVEGVVLGGIDGVKNRLSSPVIASRISALNEALNYGKPGLNLVILALEDRIRQVRQAAFLLLQERVEPQAKLAVQKYKFWSSFERLNGLPCKYVTTFANRKVVEFDLDSGINNPGSTAYSLRTVSRGPKRYEPHVMIEYKLKILLQHRRMRRLVEALVFGVDSDSIVDYLVANCNQLPNLKAVFFGDISDEECMISSIRQSNISPVLVAYPKLEVLKVRATYRVYSNQQLAFEPLRHSKLKALIIESGGLSREVVNQICKIELPALEYLELWLGRAEYGGTSSIEDLMPILSGNLFPKLKYLGLRNCEYTDDIAFAIVQSPIIEQLLELDLSMGTLGDEGAKALLNCPAVQQLDILDLSQNYVSNEIVALSQVQQSLLEKNDRNVYVHIVTDEQKGCPEYTEDEDGLHEHRYCSVAE